MAQSREKPLNQRPAYKKLKSLLAKPDPSLLSHHSVGKCVEELCPQDAKRYGSGGLKELAEKLLKSQSIPGTPQPQSFANLLWAKRNFYNTYRRDEVEQLSKQAKEGGFELTWSHINVLLPLEEADREDFQKRCITARWSGKELHRRIKETKGKRGHGGVRLRRPETEEDNLRQLIAESETWQRRFQEIWFADGNSRISLELKRTNPKVLGELREQAVTILGEMQAGIKTCLPSQKRQATKSKKKAGGHVKKSR